MIQHRKRQQYVLPDSLSSQSALQALTFQNLLDTCKIVVNNYKTQEQMVLTEKETTTNGLNFMKKDTYG